MDDKDNKLPPVGEPVWVQCDSYRTMASRDKDGKWKNYIDSRDLPDDVKVIKEEALHLPRYS